MRTHFSIALLAISTFPAAAEVGPDVEVIPGREVMPIITNCAYVTICNDAGFCSASQGRIVFEQTALDVMLHGEGNYILSYDDVKTEAFLTDQYGPLRWVVGEGQLNTFIGTGFETALWVQTNMAGVDRPNSTIHFLTCEEPA
jgi:hypothetical protein